MAKKINQIEYVATTFQGLEEVLAVELTELGATVTQTYNRAVGFKGDTKLLYTANLHLRTAIRILQPIKQFVVQNDQDLYQQTYDVDWQSLLGDNQTFAIQSAVHSPHFNHSQYVALKVKDAIADRFRNKTGSRPSVDTKQPDVRFHIHISGNNGSLLMDSSGDSLHRRGYRVAKVEAPMNEILAAGLVLLTGWRGRETDGTFMDAMCGSGTILIEAALIANKIAPNLHRPQFGFQRWMEYDESLWQSVHEEALAMQTEYEGWILGSDVSAEAIRAAKQNITEAAVDDCIKVSVRPFEQTHPPANSQGVLVMNPPYDERMEVDDIIGFYRGIGEHLKTAYSGYNAWLLTANKDALKNVGLRASKKYVLYNGSLECRYHQYELYGGSKRTPGEEGGA